MNSIWHFTVVGNGYFPIDMLRSDRCWPREQENVIEIVGRTTAQREVFMASSKAPNPERWDSFGWRVKDVREVKL